MMLICLKQRLSKIWNSTQEKVRPQLVKVLFIVIRTHWKQKWIINASKLIIFYCLTTFCNIKFFKYLLLGIFSSELYSSFLLIKPSAVQYELSISFRQGISTLSFFFMVKAREHVSNQTVHMWIFIFLISRRSSRVLWYQVSFRVSRKFWNNENPHLKY